MLLFNNFTVEAMLAVLIVLLFSMSFHEFAHAYAADYWGDDTPRRMGRLTLNPMVHINWVGFLMFAFIGFGILGSVPVNVARMRNPRWGSFWTSLAGPLSNLAIAIVAAVLLRVFFSNEAVTVGLSLLFGFGRIGVGEFMGYIPDFIVLFLTVAVYFNVLLFVFNLLPFFPIDGWHITLALLPGTWLSREQVPLFIRNYLRPISLFLQKPAFKWRDWAQASQIVLLVLIMISFLRIGFNPLSFLISQPTSRILQTLLGL